MERESEGYSVALNACFVLVLLCAIVGLVLRLDAPAPLTPAVQGVRFAVVAADQTGEAAMAAKAMASQLAGAGAVVQADGQDVDFCLSYSTRAEPGYDRLQVLVVELSEPQRGRLATRGDLTVLSYDLANAMVNQAVVELQQRRVSGTLR